MDFNNVTHVSRIAIAAAVITVGAVTFTDRSEGPTGGYQSAGQYSNTYNAGQPSAYGPTQPQPYGPQPQQYGPQPSAPAAYGPQNGYGPQQGYNPEVQNNGYTQTVYTQPNGGGNSYFNVTQTTTNTSTADDDEWAW